MTRSELVDKMLDVLNEDKPKPLVVLTPKHKHTIHELTRKAKGTYVQLLQLCKELDIPFPQ